MQAAAAIQQIGSSPVAIKQPVIRLSRPQADILFSQKPRNLYQAGQGGGKTYIMGIVSWYMGTYNPQALGGIFANTYQQLSDSTLKEIFSVWKELGWSEWTRDSSNGFYRINNEPPPSFVPHGYTFENNRRKIYLRNGGVIVTGSLDNYKAIEGQNLGWALLDETSDTKEEAVKEVITGRLRQNMLYASAGETRWLLPFVPAGHPDATSEAVNPLFIFTKPAKEQWLTEFFRLEDHREQILSNIFSQTTYFRNYEGDYCTVIASTWHNVQNVGEEYIRIRLAELTADRAEMLIYGSPFGKSGAEYYANFKKVKHVRPCYFEAGYPLHLTVDFNVNPYMSATIWQIVPVGNRTEARALCEYALVAPRNTIDDISDEYIDDWGHIQDGLYFYGDATGKNKLPLKDMRDYFAKLEAKLRDYLFSDSRRLLKQNPRHRTLGHGKQGRRDFQNALLSGNKGIDVVIDPSCKKLIADLEFIKEDQNGAKQKHEEMINGVKCQKYGHMSDGFDAFTCYVFGDFAKE